MPGTGIRLVPVGQLAMRDRRSILEAPVKWGEEETLWRFNWEGGGESYACWVGGEGQTARSWRPMLQEEVNIREGMSRARERVMAAVLGGGAGLPDDSANADRTIAGFRRRALAQAIDAVGLPLGFVAASGGSFLVLQEFSTIDPTVLITAAVLIGVAGYFWWWFASLKMGQTPGKQLVGIKVARVKGQRVGLGFMFLREFILKALLLGSLAYFSFGLTLAVDNLWPLWDRSGLKQTLHDKLLGTVVVESVRRNEDVE